MKIEVDVRLDPVAQAALPLVELGTGPANAEAVLVHVERLADAVLARYGDELDKDDNRLAGLRLLVKDLYTPPLEPAAVSTRRPRSDGAGRRKKNGARI
jgi:hypothetical protein